LWQMGDGYGFIVSVPRWLGVWGRVFQKVHLNFIAPCQWMLADDDRRQYDLQVRELPYN
jgi:hypothetical protein